MNSERKFSVKMRIFILVVVLAAAAAAAAVIIRKSSDLHSGYKKVSVERGDIDVEILSTGIVQPENRLEIKPPIAGRVDDVKVEEGEFVKKGQVLVLMSSVERAALLDAASARGKQELERWQSFYRPAPILAPIDGTIISRNVEPGQSFTTQDAILVMSDRLTVKAQVDETDIAQIRLDQQANIILDAYPDDEIPARVDKIAYDATTISNVTTYIVDVLPGSTPDFMRSGMTANVRFAIDSKEGILILPASAVKKKDNLSFVLVPASTRMGAPVEKDIETGITNGKTIEIVSGLSEGDIVLISRPKDSKGETTSTPLFRPPRKR